MLNGGSRYENSGLLKVVLQAIYIPKVGGVILSTIRDDTGRYKAVTLSLLGRRRVAENPNDPYRYDTRDHIISYHIDRFFLIRYQISE